MLSFSRCRYSILRGMSKSPICTKILDTLNSAKILDEILVNFCVHRQKVWTPLTMTRKWRKNFSRPCRQPRKFGHSWHRARKFWKSLKGGAKIQEESWTSLSTDEDRRWYFGHPLRRAMKTLDVPKNSRKHLIQILATPKIGWDFCMKFWSPLWQMKVLYTPEISWELLSLKFCSPLKSDATDSRSEILVIPSTPSLAATETSDRNFGHSWKLLTMRKHFLVVPGNTWKTVVMRRNFGHL